MNGRAFGTAIITPTVPTDSAPARGGQRFDCGRHGRLTVVQIARIAGTSRTAIYQRIRAGRTGEALCEPRWARQSEIRRASPPRRHVLAAAFQLAAMYPDRLPSVAEIQRFRPMSRQNAQVWRQAIATARRAALQAHHE